MSLSPTYPWRWEKWYLRPPREGTLGKQEMLWGGTSPPAGCVRHLSTCRDAGGQCCRGDVGFWPPSRLRGRALGEAAVGRARRELRAAAKVNSAIAVPRLCVLTGAPVPRAYATGVLPTPPILLFLTRAPVLFFLLGLFWEQPGACSIPFLQGSELRWSQGRAWHCFGHQASMWSWGTGMPGAWFTSLWGLEHSHNQWREN